MPSSPRLASVTVAVAATLLSFASAHAQSMRAVPNVAPSAAARAAQAAPNPAGLRSQFPAGITSGSGAAVSSDAVAANAAITNPSAVTAATLNPSQLGNDMTPAGSELPPASVATPTINPDGTVNTLVTNGVPGNGVARGPGQTVAMGNSGLNNVEIARAFIGADGNGDGELTRAEAARLRLALMSFEEMDRNFDGVITRSEYEDGMR